jgi:phthalate 4,5-cis-dihydrodiol dehydrogenase
VLRIGIAGLGVASLNILPELLAHPRVKVVAGADIRQSALDQFASQFGGESFTSVEAMCSSSNLDAVYILTPNRFHAEHAIIAAEYGKHVFCDKPFGLTLEQADAMIEAADRNNVQLLCGHSQCLDPAVLAMAELARSGELGRTLMVNTWFYSDWLYRPRSQDELDPSLGEGLTMRHGPVQVDIVRMLGGGLARSVKAVAAVGDPRRVIDGSFAAFIDFEDGTAATLVYSAYGYFDTNEFSWGYGLQGLPMPADLNARTHQRFRAFGSREAEIDFKDSTRFGNARLRPASEDSAAKRHAFFGITLVTCEGGDIRQTPDGLRIYGPDGARDIPVAAGPRYAQRYTTTELNLMLDALDHDRPLASHDGRWGRATLEVCLGILQSTHERSEVRLHRQTAYQPARLPPTNTSGSSAAVTGGDWRLA